jgi:excisionase family DNA binding protein
MKGKKDFVDQVLPKVEWITVEEAAESLKLSTPTVYKLLKNNRLPGGKKFGGSWRIHVPTLLASFGKEEKH